jgi:hypothetical protein
MVVRRFVKEGNGGTILRDAELESRRKTRKERRNDEKGQTEWISGLWFRIDEFLGNGGYAEDADVFCSAGLSGVNGKELSGG